MYKRQNKESVQIYRDGEDFVVKASTKNIIDVELYEMSGKLIFKKSSATREVRINAAQLANGIYTVSYTHLDVYKRQAINGVGTTYYRRKISCGSNSAWSTVVSYTTDYCTPSSTASDFYIKNVQFVGTLNPDTTNPVSYTHLDVYKRQIQNSCQ